MTLFFHTIIVLSICAHFVQASYLMATVAGSGSGGNTGDGGPATSAGISYFYGMWSDSLGNLYLPDSSTLQVRKIDTSGIINQYIGSGTLSTAGNSGPALSVSLDGVGLVYGDTVGNMYIGSNQYFIWFYNHTSGEVSRFAGATPATYGYSGDGGPATSAELSSPFGLFLSTIGVLYFVDSSNNVIRAIDTKTNIITTVAGGGTSLGDGGPATSAMLSPYTLWGNTVGVLYVADTGYSRVRKIATNGIITTIVGNGTDVYNGDGIRAINATVSDPLNCQEDSLGNLYISDNGNYRVRMVSATTGIITTIAGDGPVGNGTDVYNGDGIRAINATVSYPLNCQEDSLGNLYISDNGNYRVRMVSATTGIITTIAGDGPAGNAANTSVQIATAVGVYPSMIQLDSLGNIYFGDNAYVRKLFVAPTSRPTAAPSIVPSAIPTAIPSIVPSAIPSFIPSIVPSAIPTAIPNIVPSTIPTIAPSTSPSTVPTISPTVFPSFRPSVENVTVDSSSSRSQRLSDLHIFYATFFPAFLVAFCILPFVGYYAWMQMKVKKQLAYGEINLDDPPVTANGNDKKTVEVEKFYKWSF